MRGCREASNTASDVESLTSLTIPNRVRTDRNVACQNVRNTEKAIQHICMVPVIQLGLTNGLDCKQFQ